MREPEPGEPGFRFDVIAADGAVLGSERRQASHLVVMDRLPAGAAEVRLRP
ncbi:hypothetical protein [Prescottella equi]|uniref:hypothetical protein n=1 Tax=Rhodococcus hoagii TaxID=43767 RepID=UPI001585028E|nr:hypothetical protein [Prescottella equi]MBM4732620.1 hypothetical protein [Prescottella equi]